ncbi:MAG: hypothetical protein ACOZQL_15325 [Myxococcota bacterium]
MERLRTWASWRGTQPNTPTILHTDIKTVGILQQSILPLNWDSFRNSDSRAVWCIDSLDEASQGSRAPLAIAQALRNLSQAERSRIGLMVTCRENELPPQFTEQIEQLLVEKCRRLRIAAPGRNVAEAICSGPERLDRVLAIIQRSELQDLAEHPAALKWLAHRDGLEVETRAGVWQGVIGELLEQPFQGETPAISRHEDRFLAAARIAFMLEFGDFEEIRLAGPSSSGANPSLESLFQPSEDRELTAAREAVRSGLFQQLGGNIRIRNRHLREWLTSWQLSQLADPVRWEQIREMLGGDDPSDARGNSLSHLLLEVLARENQEASNPDLVAWLQTRQARHVENLLSNLFGAAANSPASIASPELVKRIARLAPRSVFDIALRSHTANWVALSATSKDLAFWIAEALGSQSLVEVAKKSLNDPTEAEAVRVAALRYLATLKEPLDLLAMAKATRSHPTPNARLLSNILHTPEPAC